jgi:hypothetical protein
LNAAVRYSSTETSIFSFSDGAYIFNLNNGYVVLLGIRKLLKKSTLFEKTHACDRSRLRKKARVKSAGQKRMRATESDRKRLFVKNIFSTTWE